MDPIERVRFLAPGTGAREGGEKTQPFKCFPSHRVINNLTLSLKKHIECMRLRARFVVIVTVFFDSLLSATAD